MRDLKNWECLSLWHQQIWREMAVVWPQNERAASILQKLNFLSLNILSDTHCVV